MNPNSPRSQRARRQRNASNQRRRRLAASTAQSPPDLPDVENPSGTVTFTLDAKDYVISRPAMTRDPSSGMQYSVARYSEDDILFIVVWEELSGSSRVTASMTNGFASTGIIYIDEVEIQSTDDEEVTTEMLDLNGTGWSGGGFGGLQVRGTYVSRITTGTAFHAATTTPKFSWMDSECQAGYNDEIGATYSATYGPYKIGYPVVEGESSLDGSHGGWAVSPNHFGPLGWQRCSEWGYKWAEASFLQNLHRSPLASYDPSTLEPDNPNFAYWSGRASSDLPGLEVGDPGGVPVSDPVISKLNDHKAHAHYHFHRCSAAPAMLAPRDIFARIVLVEMYWNDFTCSWDGDNTSTNPFFYTWDKYLTLAANQGSVHLGRGFAHTIGCYTMAKPYMSPSTRGLASATRDMDKTTDGTAWTTAWQNLILHTHQINSGALHTWGPDAGDDEENVTVENSGRSREHDLSIRPFERLGGVSTVLTKLYAFMLPDEVVGSVSAGIDGSGSHWTDNTYSTPNYFVDYDIIRGEYATLDLSSASAAGPREQQIALPLASYVASLPDYTP